MCLLLTSCTLNSDFDRVTVALYKWVSYNLPHQTSFHFSSWCYSSLFLVERLPLTFVAFLARLFCLHLLSCLVLSATGVSATTAKVVSVPLSANVERQICRKPRLATMRSDLWPVKIPVSSMLFMSAAASICHIDFLDLKK